MKKFFKNIYGELLYTWLNFKYWLKDKWDWLLTFNKMPEIIIKAECIISDNSGPSIEQKGRCELTLNGDLYAPPTGKGKWVLHTDQDIKIGKTTLKNRTFFIYENNK